MDGALFTDSLMVRIEKAGEDSYDQSQVSESKALEFEEIETENVKFFESKRQQKSSSQYYSVYQTPLI
jgi:hypothetical protein